MQPGQFFTSYLEALTAMKRSKYTKRDVALAHHFARIAKRHGVFFTVSGKSYDEDAGDVFKDDSIPMRPPYDVVILEYVVPMALSVEPEGAPLPRILVATDEGDHVLLTVIEFTVSDFEKNYGWLPPSYTLKIPYDGELTIATGILLPDSYANAKADYDPTTRPGIEFDKFCIGRSLSDFVTYKEFCRVLHEHEVTFEEIPVSEATNKMRRARGKAPLFTYKVLTIGKKKRKSTHQGGTHASPRSHLRRGYYRTSKTGKRHWVQPCMVKGETPGFVHKDYKVEGEVA